MTPALIPERFGCGLKLDFDELVTLRRALGRPFGADAASLESVEPKVLSSIDRIFQVGVSPLEFCRLALRHATADLISSCSRAIFVSASIEFGQELNRDGRLDLTRAFFVAAGERQVEVGKCHSSTAPVTGLTLTVEGPLTARLRAPLHEGAILLAGTLGGLEHLYRRAIAGASDPVDTLGGFNPHQSAILDLIPALAFATDVSGYGLAGALWEFALSGPYQIHLSREVIDSLLPREDSDVPPCLCASLGSYSLPGLDMRAQAMLARREFCGP